MGRALLSAACHAYGAASILFLFELVRSTRIVPQVARGFTWLGCVLHAAALATVLTEQGGRPLGLAQGFSVFGFLLVTVFIAVDLRSRAPVMGAFLLPGILALVIPSLLLRPSVETATQSPGGPWLPLHIAVALFGLATFAAASLVGVMYLLMEREVKAKRFGLLFSRLPSLQLMDEVNRWLVILGFLALSVTLVTGAVFNSILGSWARVGVKEVATVIAWVVFGTLINARHFAGWQGRRVALFTMAGFALLLLCFFTSYNPSYAAGMSR